LDDLIGVGNAAGGKAIDWSNVSARMKSAGAMFGYILLLAAGLFHGLYGLRNMIFEVVSSEPARQRIDTVLSALGLLLLAIGTWAAIASYWHASAGAV
jgi:succinate dehydrogenase hydrophobic anchor subunit